MHDSHPFIPLLSIVEHVSIIVVLPTHDATPSLSGTLSSFPPLNMISWPTTEAICEPY